MKLPASVRCWPLLWSQPLLIQSPSDQGATSRPGSVSCRSSTLIDLDRQSSVLIVDKVETFDWIAWSTAFALPFGERRCLHGFVSRWLRAFVGHGPNMTLRVGHSSHLFRDGVPDLLLRRTCVYWCPKPTRGTRPGPAQTRESIP